MSDVSSAIDSGCHLDSAEISLKNMSLLLRQILQHSQLLRFTHGLIQEDGTEQWLTVLPVLHCAWTMEVER